MLRFNLFASLLLLVLTLMAGTAAEVVASSAADETVTSEANPVMAALPSSKVTSLPQASKQPYQVYTVKLKYLTADEAFDLLKKNALSAFIPDGVTDIAGLRELDSLLVKTTDPRAIIDFTQLLSLVDVPHTRIEVTGVLLTTDENTIERLFTSETMRAISREKFQQGLKEMMVNNSGGVMILPSKVLTASMKDNPTFDLPYHLMVASTFNLNNMTLNCAGENVVLTVKNSNANSTDDPSMKSQNFVWNTSEVFIMPGIEGLLKNGEEGRKTYLCIDVNTKNTPQLEVITDTIKPAESKAQAPSATVKPSSPPVKAK